MTTIGVKVRPAPQTPTPRPGRFTPGKTRYPLYRRLGGPQGRSGRIHTLINFICNNEELSHSWESGSVPIYKKNDKIYCSNYRGISLQSVHMKFNRLFLCRLPLFVEESIGYHYCGFGLSISTTYHLFRCLLGIVCSSTSYILVNWVMSLIMKLTRCKLYEQC
jgi:hypothetical protein